VRLRATAIELTIFSILLTVTDISLQINRSVIIIINVARIKLHSQVPAISLGFLSTVLTTCTGASHSDEVPQR